LNFSEKRGQVQNSGEEIEEWFTWSSEVLGRRSPLRKEWKAHCVIETVVHAVLFFYTNQYAVIEFLCVMLALSQGKQSLTMFQR